MWHSVNRMRWFAVLLPALIGGAGCASRSAAPAAATPAEAVDALLKAVKPSEPKDDVPATADLVALFEAIAPHLADTSRETVDGFLAVVPEVRAHDQLAKKTFGAALEKAEDYVPAEEALSMMTMGTVLSQIPPGAKAEVLKQPEKSPTEAAFRLRWSKADSGETQTFEETVVAVQEGAGWKVLVPLSATVEFGSHTTPDKREDYVRRGQQEWDAAAVRSDNQAALKELQGFRAKVARLTQDLKAGKCRRVEDYLKAVDSNP